MVVEGTVRVPLSQVVWAILLCPFIPGGVDSFLASHGHWFHSVQFKVQSMSSEKPICSPLRLSKVSPTLPLKQFDSSDPFDWVPLSQVVQMVLLRPFVTGGAVWLCPFVTGGAGSLVMFLCRRWCTVWLCLFVTGGADSLVVSLCLRWCSLVVSLHHR